MQEKSFHPAPEWLTKDYLECVLRKYKKDNKLSIKSLNLMPATAKGENYVSLMTRIQVEFLLSTSDAVQQGSYIAKTAYENDPFIADLLRPYDVFTTEMLMYEKILPKLNALLEDIGDGDKLSADTIYVDYTNNAIIFEDLAVSAFTVPDRFAGMDEVQTKMALKKIAKMHATAAVFNERTPGVLELLKHGMFNRFTRGFGPVFENIIEVAANYAGDCIELGSYYKEKLLRLKSHIVEYATRVYDHHEGHFETLIHGDLWVNNIMLNYCHDAKSKDDSRTIKDLLLIDFQFSNWVSAVIDLHYFFSTSLADQLRFDREDELLQHYHGILVETLQKLEFNNHIPSLHELNIQMEECRFIAITSSLVTHVLVINDKAEDADFNNLLKTDERAQNFRKLLYTNEKVQENVKVLLPFFDRKGLLDVVT